MYSNNILNFQESTTILNACTKKKKSGNLLNAPRIFDIYNLVWFGFFWHSNHYRLINAKSSSSIYIKYTWFGFVGFYVPSTIVGYLMPNSLLYILNIYKYNLIWFGLVWFYGASTIVGYLMPNSLLYILNIYNLVWFEFFSISTIVGYLMPISLYTYILDIYDLVWLGFMAYQPW